MPSSLARKFRVDVTSDLTLATGWLQFNGINDLKPDVSPTMQSSAAYDTNGWDSQEITLQAWSLVIGAFRRQDNSGVYDPAQELVRACVGQFGTAARVGVRWYDKNGSAEAYSGIGIVKWEKAQTGVADLESITVTLTGDGVRNTITNPGVAAAAPVVVSASPSAATTGSILSIFGTGFTGTTGASHVTIGGTNATSYVVESDSLIVAVMPSGSAGSAPIVVTNAVGASNSLAYTRGA